MICANCGSSNAVAAQFCSNCGVGLPSAPLSSESVTRAETTRNQVPALGSIEQGETTQLRPPEKWQPPTFVDSGRDRLLDSTIAGRYRIDAKLGAGGMGAVYRATRLLIGDDVAVKILHSEQNDPRAGERFRREARAAARLKHPNAVSIYDFGVTDDGFQYLVMELVEGESLRTIIKQQGPLTPSAAAEIINQVCAALDEAHRHNIIHRDIKPDNIMVNVAANRLRVKVLDFGIAKLRDDTAGNLTQTGSILGTPHYMSPEQCLGEELDSRSDIYSLGIVLYEMLAGVVPFNSPISTAVVVQHVTQPPPSLRAMNVSISADVERVVLRSLAKKRESRQQTVNALAEELTTALTVTASPLAYRGVPVASMSDSGGMPTVVLPISGRSSSVDLSGSSASAFHGKRKPLMLVSGVLVVGVLSIAGWTLTRDAAGDKVSNENKSSSQPDAPRIASGQSESHIGETEIEPFIQTWRRAWETKDLYGYSSCYDENFVGRNFSSRTGYSSMTRAQWMKDKERKFRVASAVSIEVGQRTIRNEGNEVSVSFGQTFQSDKYADNGLKTLYLRRAPNGEIKIVREDFIPNRGRP